MSKYKNTYRIESARHQHWNYASEGAYFITICVKNRIHHFGECIDGKVRLSTIGAIAQGFWYEIPKHFLHVQLGEFVVMPNHIHGILILNEPIIPVPLPNDSTETGQSYNETQTIGQMRHRNQGAQTVSAIVGSFKSICESRVRHIRIIS